MRINLRLKSLQLTFSLCFLFLHILFHQILYPMCHHIKRFRQTSDLILRINLHIRSVKMPLLYPGHGIPETLKGISKTLSQKAGKKQRHDHQKCGNKHINALCLITFAQKLTDAHAAHNSPSCFIRSGNGIQLSSVSFSGTHRIFF